MVDDFWTLPQKLAGKLPDWASRALAQPRSWKLFLRCWVATWVCFVLILPQKTLEALGSACFFAAMACFMLPPNMALQVYLVGTMILLIGCLVGWAWGSIGMVSAFAARDKRWLENAVREVQQAATNDPNPTSAFQRAVFRGEFLDVRSTAVFGVFLGIGTFALTVFRVRAPKMVFAGIFGNVFLDVICSFGPLLPAPNYLTMKTFLVSTCVYVAVGLATIALIFPETLSHEWLNSYIGVLDMIKLLVDMQGGVLSRTADQLEGTIAKMNAVQEGAQAMLQGFTSMSPMLNLEFSYGRWSGTDVETLEFPLKALLTRARGVSSFANQYTKHLGDKSYTELSNTTTVLSDTSDTHSLKKSSKSMRLRVQDTPRILYIRDQITALEDAQHTKIEELVPVLRDATAELRDAISKGLESTSRAIRNVNERRYKSIQHEPRGALRLARETLASALTTYKSTTRLSIVQPLAEAFEAASGHAFDGNGKHTISYRPLFMCFVFESNLCWTTESVLALMDVVLNLLQERESNRLWAPTGLRKLGSALFRHDGTVPVRGLQAVPNPAKGDEYMKTYHRDPDSRAPTGLGQRMAHAIWSVWSYFRTNEAIFGLKCAVLTLGLWLPQVIKTSAEFTYNERGLWAMIMAQFGLEMYMSDHISGFVVRVAGTVAGGAVGTAMWYMGCGIGSGNAYGLAAAFGLFIIPLVFMRLFWYEKIAETIIFSVTLIMMGGFSWTNTHLPTAIVIYGYEIFWRRTLLVLVGFAASFVMMVLPPQSARKAVRLNNATSISEISQIYGILISSWLTTESGQESLTPQEKETFGTSVELRPMPLPYERWTPAFRAKCMALGTILEMQKRQFRTVKWERGLRGRWPGEHYVRLLETQSSMLSDLIQLSGSLSSLPPTWRHRLLHQTAFLNPNLISDVMAIFDIVSMSLRTGLPVHEVLPSNLLDRALYHDEQSRAGFSTSPGNSSTEEPLTSELLQSTEYSAYATGVSAAFHLLHALDEMHLITKELCGAIPLRGYSQWRDQHERRQLQRMA